MTHGGARPGAGRKVGSATKKTRELADKVIASGLTPLEFMLSVMRDEGAERAERLYLSNQLLRSLQEAAASELASRMTAMNNASDNAKTLAKKLTLDYNKARQAAITQEILEVVGGASAM